MKSNNEIVGELVESLKTIDPFMIYLFGSHASGEADAESDIDIVVILDEFVIPADYSERMKRKLLVRRALYELSRKIQIDIVVYTRGEFKQISELNTSFYNTLKSDGIVLYEKAG
ncbi:MAG TPA: nucleotidyltransferase domain-containing protein [Spirochaetota bacterium]|nr:nucleotidyltransferase domain-containing protein [Spirochaetota bacterium]HPJ36052.1 nucleotidyltransferase domain-containing protein [Spirochaetota bacterium]